LQLRRQTGSSATILWKELVTGIHFDAMISRASMARIMIMPNPSLSPVSGLTAIANTQQQQSDY